MFRSGLREALAWPWLAWTRRQERIEFIDGDDERGVRGGDRLSAANERGHVCALVLPPDLVLARDLVLPDLIEGEMLQALALEVERSSPFPVDDTVCGWRAQRIDESLISIRLALTSRQVVAQHLRTVAGVEAALVEVWAERDPAVVLRGFGEGRRLALERTHRSRMFALVCAVFAGFLVLAAVPFLQVRALVFEAQTQYASMQQASASALADRDALGRARTQGEAIAAVLGAQSDLLGLLEALSRAVPDAVHLTNLEVRGDLVKATGQGPAVSTIVDKLGASAQFVGLRPTSAITRVGRDGAERFSVEFRFKALPIASEGALQR